MLIQNLSSDTDIKKKYFRPWKSGLKKRLTDSETRTNPAKVPLSLSNAGLSRDTNMLSAPPSQPCLSLIHSDPAPDTDTVISLQATGPPSTPLWYDLGGTATGRHSAGDTSERLFFPSNKDLLNTFSNTGVTTSYPLNVLTWLYNMQPCGFNWDSYICSYTIKTCYTMQLYSRVLLKHVHNSSKVWDHLLYWCFSHFLWK